MAVGDIADFTGPLPRVTSKHPRIRVSAWFVPDLALVVSFVTLFFCLFVFDGSQKLFRDSDAGWHIRTGESILSGGGLPRTDPYSLTRSGQPWFAWEWGADVIMGAAHKAGGLAYVAGLYALVIAACTWLWFHLNWIAGGNFLFAAGLATLMLSAGNIHWLARPHVFSWLLLLGLVSYLERGPGRLTLIAALSALWANLHASFFLAPVMAGIYALSHALAPMIWDLDRKSEWRKARWYCVAAVVACLASLLNPYGWQLHLHVARYLLDKDLLDRIGEFQTFNFHSAGVHPDSAYGRDRGARRRCRFRTTKAGALPACGVVSDDGVAVCKSAAAGRPVDSPAREWGDHVGITKCPPPAAETSIGCGRFSYVF